jgi:hypothetical protein
VEFELWFFFEVATAWSDLPERSPNLAQMSKTNFALTVGWGED